ncbi:MAG: Kazal-type serine protease inhibitor family protein [Acidobacteriota bacterium]
MFSLDRVYRLRSFAPAPLALGMITIACCLLLTALPVEAASSGYPLGNSPQLMIPAPLATPLANPLTPPPPPCIASDTTLCIEGQRLRITMTYRNQRTGEEGQAKVTPIGESTGLFWFFREDNIEAVVKVLDGSAINGHYWVFIGSLTDLEFEITVDDTNNYDFKTYRNEPGNRYGIADDRAVPSVLYELCGTIQGLTCPATFYCAFPDATCQVSDRSGSCIPKPTACTTDFIPVCGCDGRTYSNRCEMARAGISLASEGLCP